MNEAPDTVIQCMRSWSELNPEWVIHTLDQDNIDQYIDLDKIIARNADRLTPQALSDIVRINLLRKYGGVWADATCFCCRPLDSWLNEYAGSGFFAYQSPGVDRPIASWFLAATKESQIVAKLCTEVNAYWTSKRFRDPNGLLGGLVDSTLHTLLKRSHFPSLRFACLWAMLHKLRIYPYFWMHYIFAQLLRHDESFRCEWEATPPLPSDPPHSLQEIDPDGPLTLEMKRQIDNSEVPIYKLDWRSSSSSGGRTPALACLVEQLEERHGQ